MGFIPSYKKISSADFSERINKAELMLKNCNVCPRCCGVDRLNGELGTCQSGSSPVLSSYTLHFGEEPVLSGKNGAGNIFFGNCNLRCVYCQNHVISQNPKSERIHTVSVYDLADIMLLLQNRGAHNIGLVSPTHFAVPILKSIMIASRRGLNLPIIYNTNAYDSPETLNLFNDVVDIYLPDFKYGENRAGRIYSKVNDYFDKAKSAIREMYRQVGSGLTYNNGVVVRGLIIRHLILPNGIAETEKVFKFICGELDKKVHLSLMSQYYPANRTERHILLDRNITGIEYLRALDLLSEYGLKNGWIQELESNEFYRPVFEESRKDPFIDSALF